jgi:hypothetical protein
VPISYDARVQAQFPRVLYDVEEVFAKKGLSPAYPEISRPEIVNLVYNPHGARSIYLIRERGFPSGSTVSAVAVARESASPRQNIQRSLTLQCIKLQETSAEMGI